MNLTRTLTSHPRLAWLPGLALVLSLALTWGVWRDAKSGIEAIREEKFALRVAEIEYEIRARLQAYEQVLLGTAGLFDAAGTVDRAAFKSYVEALRLADNYPGIQGVGFSLFVPADEVARHVERLRQEGFPDYRLQPEGAREAYSAIVYLEPFDWRNRRAFGYDMYSEPVRRAAMELARDSGGTALSGKVTLVQETERDVQAGFLMYVPVYRARPAPDATVAQRRAALLGWVYAPFRMRDLMLGIRERHLRYDTVAYAIYDGDEPQPDSLLLAAGLDPGRAQDGQGARRHIDIHGHAWTLVVQPLSSLEQAADARKLSAIAVTGCVGGLLLALLLWVLVNSRGQALRLAGRMNREVLERERYQKALLEQLPAAVVVHAPDGVVQYRNAEACRMLGLGAAEPAGSNTGLRFLHEDGRPMEPRNYPVSLVLSTAAPLHGYVAGIVRDGADEPLWVVVSAFPYFDAAGGIHQVIVSFLDISLRRRAELALQRTLAELDDLYDHAPCGYHSLDTQGRIVRINRTELDWLGYRREEVLGEPFARFITPASLELFRANYPEFKARGAVRDLEYELIRKDGSTLSVLLSATAIYGADGHYAMSRSTLYDITARKQAEAALEQTRSQLQRIIDVNPAAIYRVQLDGQGRQAPLVTFMSRNIVEVTGHPLEAWSSPGFWEAHLHPEDRERVLAAQAGLYERGALTHEYRFCRRDGRTLWINDRLVLVRDPDGRAREIVGTWLDITERVEAEQNLQRLNRSYAVLSLVNEAIVRTSDEQALFAEICRITVEEGGLVMAWVGLVDAQGAEVRPVARAGRDDGYLAFLEERGVFRYDGPTARAIRGDAECINPDVATSTAMGPWREEALRRGYLASAAFPIRRSGVPVGALSLYAAQAHSFSPEIVALLRRLVDDVSFALDYIEQNQRRRQAERDLQSLNEALEQRVAERTRLLEATNRELEAFSYTVSHDLRAPLRGIDGFSQLLERQLGDRLDATGRDYLQRVRRASRRMAELIDDLLELSRVSRAELRRERVDLSRIAREIVAELQAAAPQRRVEIEIQEGVEAHADARLIRVVLENLLGNAWKFTAHQAPARIAFGCHVGEQGGPVYFVRDNGAGFDMRYADKLFGAFQRLHTADEFEGTGIGLATVQRIVNRHGGTIRAEAEPGKGAAFFFSLD